MKNQPAKKGELIRLLRLAQSQGVHLVPTNVESVRWHVVDASGVKTSPKVNAGMNLGQVAAYFHRLESPRPDQLSYEDDWGE